MIWKACSNKKCSYVWLSNPLEDNQSQRCPMCGRFNQRILNVEQELRKQSNIERRVKKASMFL